MRGVEVVTTVLVRVVEVVATAVVVWEVEATGVVLVVRGREEEVWTDDEACTKVLGDWLERGGM